MLNRGYAYTTFISHKHPGQTLLPHLASFYPHSSSQAWQQKLSNGEVTLDRYPFPLETSLPGVFSAGDVRHNSIQRVSSGVGEGSMASAFIHQYLASRQESLEVRQDRR